METFFFFSYQIYKILSFNNLKCNNQKKKQISIIDSNDLTIWGLNIEVDNVFYTDNIYL